MASPKSGNAGMAVPPAEPDTPFEADKADPGEMTKVKAREQETQTGKYGSPSIEPHRPPNASQNDGSTQSSEERREKKSWIEIELVDKKGKPVPGEAYRITLPDGVKVAEGTLNEKGLARVDGIDPGMCKVTFPKLEKQAWKPR